jgi:hypothetical protein
LMARVQDWSWSSARAHLAARDDHVVTVAQALERIGDFRAYLGEDFDEALTYAGLRKAETIGRSARRNGSKTWPSGPAWPCFSESAARSSQTPGPRCCCSEDRYVLRDPTSCTSRARTGFRVVRGTALVDVSSHVAPAASLKESPFASRR